MKAACQMGHQAGSASLRLIFRHQHLFDNKKKNSCLHSFNISIDVYGLFLFESPPLVSIKGSVATVTDSCQLSCALKSENVKLLLNSGSVPPGGPRGGLFFNVLFSQ